MLVRRVPWICAVCSTMRVRAQRWRRRRPKAASHTDANHRLHPPCHQESVGVLSAWLIAQPANARSQRAAACSSSREAAARCSWSCAYCVLQMSMTRVKEEKVRGGARAAVGGLLRYWKKALAPLDVPTPASIRCPHQNMPILVHRARVVAPGTRLCALRRFAHRRATPDEDRRLVPALRPALAGSPSAAPRSALVITTRHGTRYAAQGMPIGQSCASTGPEAAPVARAG